MRLNEGMEGKGSWGSSATRWIYYLVLCEMEGCCVQGNVKVHSNVMLSDSSTYTRCAPKGNINYFLSAGALACIHGQ